MPAGHTPDEQNGSVMSRPAERRARHAQLPELPSTHFWTGGQGALPHATENEPIQVNGTVVVGQEVVVVVMVVVAPHVPQSCAHVVQSSEGPQCPSPRTQARPSHPVEQAGGW